MLLKEQLINLGWIATDIEENSLAPIDIRSKATLDEIKVMLNDLTKDLDNEIQTGDKNKNLVENLLPVVSAIVEANNDRYSPFYSDARKVNIQNIHLALEGINTIKRSFADLKVVEENLETFERIVIQFSTLLAILNQTNIDLTEFTFLKYLEKESELFLRTGLGTLNYIDNVNKNSLNRIFDYTPPTITLAKVFEKEVNYSITHWNRELINIDLPPYFIKYQPGIVHGVLNKKAKDGSWYAPELGRGLSSFENNIKKQKFPSNITENTCNELLSIWFNIKELRNKAAHPNIVDKSNTNSLLEKFKRLEELNIFQKFYELKQLYRGY